MKNKITHLFSGLLKKSGPDAELKALMAQSAQDPSDLRLKLQIGKIFFKKKDVQKGIEIYRDVAERYIEDNFLLKSIAIYKEILKYSPGSVEFNEKLGDQFHKIGMASDAAQQYQIVVHHHLTHHQAQEAARVCEKLVQADSENYQHRMKLAEILFNLGKEDESLREYENLARKLRKEMSNVELLAEVYEKILLKRPQEMGLLRELCVFYLKLKNPQKALRKIERYKLEKDEQFKPIYQKALQLKEMISKSESKK